MSGAASFAPKRARFQGLHVKLVSLLQIERCITSAAARQERQKEAVERLCALVTVMRAEGDFHLIDDLLAQAEDASCQ
jgi:hypothetical protein